MADLLALAARCEKAEGPERELDAVIFNAIGRPLPTAFMGHDVALDYDEIEHTFTMPMGDLRVRYECATFTFSIDAALTLVPDEHAVDLTMWGPLWGGKHRARVLPLAQDGDRWLHRGSEPHYCVNAATPALALCAAALRARAVA